MSLDTALMQLICHNNALTSLNLKNGNNADMQGDENYAGLDARVNPNLLCIQVDDAVASSGYQFWYKDAMASYSENCNSSALEDRLSETEIKIFPNPAQNKFSVQSSKFRVGDATIELFDLNGIKHLEKQISLDSINLEVDVSQIINGIYFCKIRFDNKYVTRKIIVWR